MTLFIAPVSPVREEGSDQGAFLWAETSNNKVRDVGLSRIGAMPYGLLVSPFVPRAVFFSSRGKKKVKMGRAIPPVER